MRVEPSGRVPCDLAIFGEAPGFEDQMQGETFVGKAGKQLWSNLKRFTGLTRDRVYASNIIKEGLPKNRDPKAHEISAALPEFMEELERVQPRIVIAAGQLAAQVFLGDVRISNVHGIPHNAEIAGQHYVCHPIYHPGAGLSSKGVLAAFAYDLKQLDALLRGQIWPWAPARHPARSEWLLSPPKQRIEASVVSVDTEGWADNPKMLSYSPDGVHAWVIRADSMDVLRWFARWIGDKTVVMHNGLHDLPVLRAMGVDIGEYHDTQVLAYHEMLQSGSGVLEAEAQNLGTLAYRELGLVLRELSDLPGVDFDTQTIPYSDEVRDYAGADACATRRLYDRYEALRKYEPYQIDMGQVRLVEGMVGQGLPFDRDAAVDYYAEVIDKLLDCTSELQRMAAKFGKRDFNPGSHPQVREIITHKIGLRVRKRTKGGLASTNEKALADFKDHPFVSKLQEHRELVKLKGTYAEPLLEELSL